jgi:selenocysteine lyase/cysteine desulfurase
MPSPFNAVESNLIRLQFPIFEKYVFLNAASLCPIPLATCSAIAGVAREIALSAYLGYENWKIRVAQTRKLAAELVGGCEDEVAFIRNTSDGVSLVASGYPFAEGDEVVINDLEFPSNVYPWLNLRSKGVTVRTVKSVDGRVTPDMIAREVTAKTKIVAISTVQYATGYRADLAALGQMARDSGFLLFVDAIQSLGALPMDVKKYGVDFLSCGGHKWLCAPEGIGVFYCAKERLDLLRLTRAGWNTVKDEHNFAKIDFTPKPSAGRFEEGTPNLFGIYGLCESLKTVMSYGMERNEAHILSLTGLLAEGLRSRGYAIASPMGEGERSGILIFTAKDKNNNAQIVKRLNSAGILVMERGAGIRVAPHFFNTAQDIQKLLAEL